MWGTKIIQRLVRTGSTGLATSVALLGGTLPAGSQSPGDAPVPVSRQEYTYTVDSLSADALLEEVSRKGPHSHADGQRRWTRTQWHVSWRYWYDDDPKGCRIARVEVKLAADSIFPVWSNRARAPQTLRARWDETMASLRTQEQTHIQFGMDTAQAIRVGIAALDPQASCDDLGMQANALGHALVREGVERDRAFEQTSKDGAAFLTPSTTD